MRFVIIHGQEIIMAKCDLCGNDYNKAFTVVQQRCHSYLRQFPVRHSRNGSRLRPLRLSNHQPRNRESGRVLLLRALRKNAGIIGVSDRAA